MPKRTKAAKNTKRYTIKNSVLLTTKFRTKKKPETVKISGSCPLALNKITRFQKFFFTFTR